MTFTKQEELSIYQLAISRWGNKKQLDVAVEEFAELIVALMKYPREINSSSREDVIDELADAEIMLAQMKLIFERYEGEPTLLVEDIKQKKLARLLKYFEVKT